MSRYPTADTQILCFAIAYLFFIKEQFSSYLKAIFIIILIIGVLINATGTGFLSLLFMCLFLGVYTLFTQRKLRLVYIRIAILIFSLLIAVYGVIVFGIDKNQSNIQDFSRLFEKKFDSISSRLLAVFGNSSTEEVDDSSFEVRENEMKIAFTRKNDIVSMSIGGPVSIGALIENENFFLLRSYGYVGFLFYYLWIAWLLFKSIRNLKNEYGRLLFVSIFIILFSNLSTITSFMFGIAVSFALLISFCITEIDVKLRSDVEFTS